MNRISAKAWRRAAAKAAIANALGDPARLARELRAEAGFRRWESERSAGSLIGAVIALLGLATLDLIFLIPFVCVVGAILLSMFVSAIALFFAGGAVWLFASVSGPDDVRVHRHAGKRRGARAWRDLA